MEIAILKQIKHGDWIFTCSMRPQQFDSFHKEKNIADYNRLGYIYSDLEWERFSKYNDFSTINGGHHSVNNCSLKLITEKYALWFIENKCWELFDKAKEETKSSEEDVWLLYEKYIKELCERDQIQFEGF